MGTLKACSGVLLASLLWTGCFSKDVPVQHIAWNDQDETFELGTSIVSTFNNTSPVDALYQPAISSLEGQHVTVKGGGRLVGNLCAGTMDAATATEDQYYARGIISAPSKVAIQYNEEPLTGRIIPADHDSLALLSGYVSMDRVAAFYRDTIGDTSRATKKPAVLAFYSEGALGCDPDGDWPLPGISVPFLVADNAAYVRNADMFIILRDVYLAGGAEVGTNPGVLAHEFGHRVFQQNVYGASREGFELLVKSTAGSSTVLESLCSDVTPADDFPDCTLSTPMLNGFDEGNSDIFAYSFTGRPAFLFDRSITSTTSDEAKLRDLSRAPGLAGDMTIFSREEMVSLVKAQAFQFYRLGTLWTRGFYAGICRDDGTLPTSEKERVELARKRFAPAVLAAERQVGKDFLEMFRFEPQQFLRRYVEAVSTNANGTINNAVRERVCQPLCDRFGFDTVAVPLGNAGPVCGGMVGQNTRVRGGSFTCQL